MAEWLTNISATFSLRGPFLPLNEKNNVVQVQDSAEQHGIDEVNGGQGLSWGHCNEWNGHYQIARNVMNKLKDLSDCKDVNDFDNKTVLNLTAAQP